MGWFPKGMCWVATIPLQEVLIFLQESFQWHFWTFLCHLCNAPQQFQKISLPVQKGQAHSKIPLLNANTNQKHYFFPKLVIYQQAKHTTKAKALQLNIMQDPYYNPPVFGYKIPDCFNVLTFSRKQGGLQALIWHSVQCSSRISAAAAPPKSQL